MGDTKRRVKTPAERVAEAEAALAKAKEAAEAKTNKAISRLLDQRAKHVEVITERTDKVEAIDTELEALGYEPAEVEDDVASIEDYASGVGPA